MYQFLSTYHVLLDMYQVLNMHYLICFLKGLLLSHFTEEGK